MSYCYGVGVGRYQFPLHYIATEPTVFIFAAMEMPAIIPPMLALFLQAAILISAGVGALLGIISSIAMEYVKPWVAKRLLRRTVSHQLVAELADNMREVGAAKNLLQEEASKPVSETILAVIKISMNTINSDRFDYYFAEQKAFVYELDEEKLLITFYNAMKTARPLVSDAENFTDLRQFVAMAYSLGKMYLEKHRHPFMAGESPIIDAFRATRNKNQDASDEDVNPS